MGRRPAQEYAPPGSALHPDSWPRINEHDRTLKDFLPTFYRLRKAILAKFAYTPDKQITAEYAIGRRQLHRLIARCRSLHPDGKIWGWRALLPGLRKGHRLYRRTKLVTGKVYPADPKNPERLGGLGLSGALQALLDRFYPDLDDFLHEIRLRHERDPQHPQALLSRHLPVGAIHGQFLKKLRELGVGQDEWPFFTESKGKEALRRYLNAIDVANPEIALGEREGPHQRRVAGIGWGAPKPGHLGLFRQWMFDAHTMDWKYTILVRTPEGEWKRIVPCRGLLLTLMSVDERPWLAFVPVYRPYITQGDVVELFDRAIRPRERRGLTIPGVAYAKDGCLVQEIADMWWAVYNVVSFDNAKPHVGQHAIALVKDKLGGAANAGRSRFPEMRAIKESFYKRLEARIGHRLPSTVGSGPNDPRGQDADEAAVNLAITADEVEELLEVEMVNYNGRPSRATGMNGRSPIQVIQDRLAGGHLPRTVPEEHRDGAWITSVHASRVVRGADGRRPHVNYERVVYTSPILAEMRDLIGTRINLEPDLTDLRTIPAFYEDNSPLDVLIAAGAWAHHKHSLTTRRAIMRLPEIRDADDQIDAYNAHLEERAAAGSQRAAGELQALQSERDRSTASASVADAVVPGADGGGPDTSDIDEPRPAQSASDEDEPIEVTPLVNFPTRRRRMGTLYA